MLTSISSTTTWTNPNTYINMKNKEYWKGYSGIEWGKHALYCNTGNGSWALFKDGVFVKEGPEHKLPKKLLSYYKELQ